MEAAIVLIVFIALVIIGVPIGWSIAGVSLLTLFFSDVSFSILPMKMISGVNSFTFLCIPFFILAANLMSRGGITKRIFLFCDALCGHFSGGLAHANVLASMLFGGISGASNADAVGLGSIEIEMMTEKGYDRGYSAAVTAASAILSSIVPPSNIFIVYAVTAGTVTVSAMFVGGIIPAVILTLLLIALNVYYAKKYHFPKNEKFAGWKYVGKTALETLPALFMPIIILGGILAGVFTPTESSVVAGVYALIVSAFVLRNLTRKDVYEALVESAKMTAVVMFIIAVASAMGWGITTMRLPQKVSAWCLAMANSKLQFMFITFILLVIIGTLVDVTPAILIIVPILVPAARAFNVNMLYFGLFVAMTLTMGLVTPPVGMLLFTTSTVAKIDLSRMYKAILPYAVVEILFCILMIFAEPILMFLPHLLGY